MIIVKKQFSFACFALAACGLFVVLCSQAWAAQRILLSFDGNGHRIHRIVQAPSRNSNPVLEQRKSAFARSRVSPQTATATWFDINGDTVKVGFFADPRTTHAPYSSQDSTLKWVVLQEGAYLLEGPDTAVQLKLSFPSRNWLGLPEENWLLNLQN